MGTMHSVTGRFQESNLHRLLFGNESEEKTVGSVPFAVCQAFWKQAPKPRLNLLAKLHIANGFCVRG